MESIPDKKAPKSNYVHTASKETEKAKAKKYGDEEKQARSFNLNNTTEWKARLIT